MLPQQAPPQALSGGDPQAAVKGVEDAFGGGATEEIAPVEKTLDKPAAPKKVTLTTPFNRRAETSKDDVVATQTGMGKSADKPARPRPLKAIGRELEKVANSVKKAFDPPADSEPAADTKDDAKDAT